MRVGELEEAPELLILEDSEEEGSDDSVVEVEECSVEEAVGKAAAKLGLRKAVEGVAREVEGRVGEMEAPTHCSCAGCHHHQYDCSRNAALSGSFDLK